MASSPVLMFCASGLVFGGTEGIEVSFSYFALSDLFSAVPRASVLVFKFCAAGLIFGGTVGV
jgi:hypothetical protein